MKPRQSAKKQAPPPLQLDGSDLLIQRLRLARPDDLKTILEGDLKVSKSKYKDASGADLVEAVSTELRTAAGHSLRNLFRGQHQLPYKVILVDVADKLAPGRFKWSKFKAGGPEQESEIEDYIYERLVLLIEEYLKSLKDSERKQLQRDVERDLRAKGLPQNVVASTMSALAAGTISGALIGPTLAAALFGSFWTWVFGLSLGKILLGGVLGGGPVGIVIALAIVVTAPSYSKTIPAVTRVIMLKLEREARDGLSTR